tara:strand:- start:788 stop:1882 length:1095 start_codon:yes stop_codon:yes gene_type:complete
MNIPKINFDFPKKNSVLIFDRLSSEYIKKYIGTKNIFIIKIRNTVNFFAFLYGCIFFYRTNFKTEYINFFLKKSETKLFISARYRSIILFTLKKYNPNTKFLIIQNGNFGDNFISLLKKNNHIRLSCDYFFCFSSNEKKILSKYINANYILSGSMKNNFYRIDKLNKKKEVIFISQYRKSSFDEKSRYYHELKFIQKNNLFILPILHKFCLKNNLKLRILPGENNLAEEKKYYANILKSRNFYIYKKDTTKSYIIIDKSIFCVSIDSTLGYEALGRGIKTCIICCKKFVNTNFKGQVSSSAKILNKNYKYYLSTNDKNQLEKIFSKIYKVDNLKFLKSIPLKEIMKYDVDNSYLSSTIQNLLKN